MERLLRWPRREQQRQVQQATCPNQRKVSSLRCSAQTIEDRRWPFSTVQNRTEAEAVTGEKDRETERSVTEQSKSEKRK